MAVSSIPSRQSSRSQVLHSSLACRAPASIDDCAGAGAEGFREGGFTRVSPGGSSSSTASFRRRPIPRRPMTREEQHEELLKNIQKRYKVDCIPNMTQIRLSTAVAGYRVSADIYKPRRDEGYVSLGLKMGEDPLLVKKVVLTPKHSDVRMFTPAMEFGVLRLQFAFGYDWHKRTFGASWRCKTKWTRDSKVQRRVNMMAHENMELTSFWNFRSELPSMGGKFGSNSSSIEGDIGRLQLALDRLKASFKF